MQWCPLHPCAAGVWHTAGRPASGSTGRRTSCPALHPSSGTRRRSGRRGSSRQRSRRRAAVAPAAEDTEQLVDQRSRLDTAEARATAATIRWCAAGSASHMPALQDCLRSGPAGGSAGLLLHLIHSRSVENDNQNGRCGPSKRQWRERPRVVTLFLGLATPSDAAVNPAVIVQRGQLPPGHKVSEMASRPAEYAIDSKWDQALDVTCV